MTDCVSAKVYVEATKIGSVIAWATFWRSSPACTASVDGPGDGAASAGAPFFKCASGGESAGAGAGPAAALSADFLVGLVVLINRSLGLEPINRQANA